MIGIKEFLFGYFYIEATPEKIAAVYDLLLNLGIGARRMKNGRLAVREKHRKILMESLSSLNVCASETLGLPHYIRQNRKRYGIFAALLLCAFLMIFTGGRVWDIRIQGVTSDEQKDIITALDAQGLSAGVAFRSLDFSKIENSLQKSCPNVAWVNIHRRGTVVYVNVIGAQAEQMPGTPAIGNLAADEDCVIVEISPDSGVSCVEVGDTVRKGDLLISAVHPDGTFSGASGTVLGRVSGEIRGHACREETKTVTEKIKNVEVTLNFFDFSLNIFKNYRNLPNGYDIIENERQLRFFGRISLPVSVTLRTAYIHHEETVHFSDAEAIRLAGVRLRSSLSELLSKGELESLRTEGAWTEDGYVFFAYYVQIRNVAELKPIHTAQKIKGAFYGREISDDKIQRGYLCAFRRV